MASLPRYLTALPVYNEAAHVDAVLGKVAAHASDVLVVDDGSDDGTAELLAARGNVIVLTHPENRGYGAALATAFDYAQAHGYEVLVTIDCDGQHEPQRIEQLVAACKEVDIVSGSRYLDTTQEATSEAPVDRRLINQTITHEINTRLGLRLTDTFCGFKAYSAAALRELKPTEPGYAMPLELWVQAAHAGLRIVEVAVPLIYLDEKRSFGGALDDADERLSHYREVICRAMRAKGQPVTPKRAAGANDLEPCVFTGDAPVDWKPC